MTDSSSRRRRIFLLSGIVVIVLGGIAALALRDLPRRATAYVTSDSFRRKISEETSHGLKVEGKYGPLQQQGWGVTTPGFESLGRPGESIAELDAYQVAGRFNPWGVFRRRWQLDWVTIDHATVTLRLSDPAKKIPLPVKPKPWYHFLLPQRIYLKEVLVDRTEVLWNFRDQPAGIHHIRLRITPHGKKDWRFQSDDGSGLLQMAAIPPLRIDSISVVLTKPWFLLEEATLAPDDAADPGRLHLEGKSGLQEDKTLALTASIDRMPLDPWLPEKLRTSLHGRVEGKGEWLGAGTKVEHSSGHGTLRLAEAALDHFKPLDQLALFSNNPKFRELKFTEASLAWDWKDPRLVLSDIRVEAPGLVRLEGRIEVDQGVLSGELFLGLRPDDLKWLPRKGTTLFTEKRGDDGLLWTRIALSGTAKKPVEDFTPRLRKALLQSPGKLIELGFKELFGGIG